MLLDRLLAQIAPHECLSCSTEGKLLCSDCRLLLKSVPPACYRCRKLSDTSKTCASCRSHSDLFAVHAATIYEGLAKELVWQLKFQGAQAAAEEMADMLSHFVPNHPDFVIIPAPTATSRARQRGYDQAEVMAQALARKTGVQYLPALRRSGQHHQVGSKRSERIRQLQSAYRVVRPADVVGKHVLLVDDVLTTGATLEAAAKVLKAAGAKRVTGLVFARA